MNKYDLYAKFITKQNKDAEASLVAPKEIELSETNFRRHVRKKQRKGLTEDTLNEGKTYIKSGWGVDIGHDFTRLTKDTPIELTGESKGDTVYGWIEGDPKHSLGFMRAKRIKVAAKKRSIVGLDEEYLNEEDTSYLNEGLKRKFTNWLNRKERVAAHKAKLERYAGKFRRQAKTDGMYDGKSPEEVTKSYAKWKTNFDRAGRWDRVGFDAERRAAIYRDISKPDDWNSKSGKWLGGKWEAKNEEYEGENDLLFEGRRGRLPKWANEPDFVPQRIERGPPGSETKSTGQPDRRKKYKFSMGPLGSASYAAERPKSLRAMKKIYNAQKDDLETYLEDPETNANRIKNVRNRLRALKQQMNDLRKHPAERRKRSKWEKIARDHANMNEAIDVDASLQKIVRDPNRLTKRNRRLES